MATKTSKTPTKSEKTAKAKAAVKTAVKSAAKPAEKPAEKAAAKKTSVKTVVKNADKKPSPQAIVIKTGATHPKTAEAKKAKKVSQISEHQQRLNEKIRQLEHLSKEKGYLTNQDINKYLTEILSRPEEYENVRNILESLNVEILDTDEEIENFKHRREESEERQSKSLQSDSLDDPVRMYLKQMGQVPLLSRDEEVSISKRIEAAGKQGNTPSFSVSLTNKFQIDVSKETLGPRGEI